MKLNKLKQIIREEIHKLQTLNEADYYEGALTNLANFCSNCPCGCGDVIENCVSAGGQGYACASCKENCGGTTGTPTGGAGNTAGFSGKTDDDRFINRPEKPMSRKPIPRKPMPKRPIRAPRADKRPGGSRPMPFNPKGRR